MVNGIPATGGPRAAAGPDLLRSHAPLAHNSLVTDDATDGRPWPIDPLGSEPDPEAAPVPDLTGLDDLSKVLTDFASSANRSASTAFFGVPTPPVAPPPAVETVSGVTDEDRNRFGILLDHAAERGLLSLPEYEVRLGELAAATSVDEMRQIVTELPVFNPVAANTAPRSRRSGLAAGLGGSGTAPGGRRRVNPWVMLGVLLVVAVVLLVFFAVYAEHLVHSHGAGLPSSAVALRLSALRL